MKKITRIMATLVLFAVLVNVAGCYGSFSLTKKVYQWNGTVGDKFINSAVMWIFMILPVYEAAGFIDVVVLNTMEFWTGTNPLAMKDGQAEIKYTSRDGKTYKKEVTKNQIVISETAGPDQGQAVTLNFVPETGNWTLSNGQSQTLIAQINGANMQVFSPKGETRTIKLAE